jgi:hypothetical protein
MEVDAGKESKSYSKENCKGVHTVIVVLQKTRESIDGRGIRFVTLALLLATLVCLRYGVVVAIGGFAFVTVPCVALFSRFALCCIVINRLVLD